MPLGNQFRQFICDAVNVGLFADVESIALDDNWAACRHAAIQLILDHSFRRSMWIDTASLWQVYDFAALFIDFGPATGIIRRAGCVVPERENG